MNFRPENAPQDPLDWLAGTHARLRGFCALLERLASGAAVPGSERHSAADFVRDVLPVHLRDEEDDLFPLLRRRCSAEDEIELVLAMLGAEHDQEADRNGEIEQILRKESRSPQAELALISFAREQRQHVAIEDGVVLPIARIRLGRRDLAALRGRMLGRRAQPS